MKTQKRSQMKTKIYFLILLSVFSLNGLTAQKRDKKVVISGYVVDKNQYPVVNAGILIDNTEAQYVTDANGYYKVKVNSAASKISFIVPGLGIIEEPIDGRKRINISLDASVPQQVYNMHNEADDINIGYGTESKQNLTTPVNKINGRENKFASYATIYDMIRGEVPGVKVSGKSIKVQNASSFLMGTEPLYIVDGVTMRSIDLVMPQMVKSIEVLKGASASIYGSRGSNGVILITLIR
jgi:TonB-dependent SusC/RagA subfamily outer membrane receptor